VPVGGDADDRDVLTRTRRVAVAVLVCGIAVSACAPSGPEPVSVPVTPSPTLVLATPSPTLALATPSPTPVLATPPPLPSGTITTYAGRDLVLGDGGPATAAQLDSPRGVALDPAGNLYIADASNHRIRRVTAAGTVSTYAGSGTPGFSGDGGPATAAQLNQPVGVAVDRAGNLYIADFQNQRIRKVTPGGAISTYAGSGGYAFSGDGGPATSAQLAGPFGVALDPAGNLYIADRGNFRIRKVTTGGMISTYAGSGGYAFSGDGGPATAAQLNSPEGVALDPVGNLYIADVGNQLIRKVTPGGTISTYAGSGSPAGGFSGDGGPATTAQLNQPVGVALDPAGNLYIADAGNSRIRRVSTLGTISTYAGTGTGGFSGDGGPATAAHLRSPLGVALDPAGNLYVADDGNHRIRKVSTGGIVSTYAGTIFRFSGDGGPATAAQLYAPGGVALDPAGNLYIADTYNHRIRKVTPDGTISTYAGTGTPGFSGDGGPATAAQLRYPTSVAVDPAGNLYITDNNRIRKVTPGGTISTYAGTGGVGFSGDGGPATAAQLAGPAGVALDSAGNLYIADRGNFRIRKVTPGGTISTYAGGGTGPAGCVYQCTFSGDGGPATVAQLDAGGVALDPAGNLYIADAVNDRIRKVTPGGTISTYAGSDGPYSGDGGPATAAQLLDPVGVALDSAGNLYIAEYHGNRISKVTLAGTISTYAGSFTRGTPGFSGDGGPATAAHLSVPAGLALDSAGNLYIADRDNHRIRKVTP
jgi:sugar lactone lactonase YvrE